jgi:uncharacterized protein (DUF952 family)
MGEMLFKIVPATLWREAEAAGEFTGSPVDVADGFIHLSNAAQVRATAARHFAGQDGLLLVAVTATALESLRWEAARNGELFPHLYGVLSLKAVRAVAPLPLGDGGQHVFPDLASAPYTL